MTRWDGAGGRGQGVARTLAGATAPLVDASRVNGAPRRAGEQESAGAASAAPAPPGSWPGAVHV